MKESPDVGSVSNDRFESNGMFRFIRLMDREVAIREASRI